MKAEDFAMRIIDEIDEKMVEDAWTENDMKIYISESRPLSFWRIAATVAACFAAVVTGMFCFTKMNSQEITPPNTGVLSSPESVIDISSETTDENEHPSILETLPKEGEENIILFDDSHATQTFYAEKFNTNGYARINIEETNASEEHPVYLVLYNADALIEDEDAYVLVYGNVVSEGLKITGPGEYTMEYIVNYCGAGTINCLNVECSPADYDGLILKGNWLP